MPLHCPLWRGIAPLLSLLLIAQPAAADVDDTFNLNVGAAIQQDDNLFRLSSSADPNILLGKPSKSEQITISSVGFKLNKSYSLQRIELDASAVDYRFQTFGYLNYTARNYTAAWRWKLTPNFYGNLTGSRNETLNSFIDYTGYNTRSLRVDDNRRFDGVFEIDGAWRVLGGVAEYKRRNSQLFTQENDNRVATAEAGVRYAFHSGSSLTYMTRSGRGDYTSLQQPVAASLSDNRFDDRENEVSLHWLLAGKTTLDARAAHHERKHAHFAARDYGGNTGNVNLNWEITGKTFLAATLARELSSYQAINSSYSTTDRVTLSPYWQFGAKTALRGRYDYARRDYRGAIAPTPFNDRSDTLRSGMLSLEYQPLRALSLSTSLQSDKRASNLPGLDYDATVAAVSAQLSF